MDLLNCLQNYWWLLIAVLGAALVFLLFVQGGQSMLMGRMTDQQRTLTVNSLGRKWELTFTTLVVFGGAFFASFPLFYSTSFGGAYWLWMLILLSFILQAVSYEFRSKPGNVFGQSTYDIFLFINGFAGCVLLGVAVGMQFFGADFEVSRQSILDAASPVISTWNPQHGWEQIFSIKNLLLGVAVYFLARTMGALFFGMSVRTTDGSQFPAAMRTNALVNGSIFVLFFLAFLFALFMSPGYAMEADGIVVAVPYKYFFNFIDLWWIGATFLIGVLLVLFGIVNTTLLKGSFKAGFWITGVGVVLAVTSLFCISGYNNTAYLPSTTHPESSLFITNSSSTYFTLKVMAWVTVLLPVVIGYIAYVWHKMTTKPLTTAELDADDHIY